MRLAKFILPAYLALSLGLCVLAVASLYGSSRHLIIGLVVGAILLISTSFVVTVHTYRRISEKLERLAEKLLSVHSIQERRYNQTRARLDELLTMRGSRTSESPESIARSLTSSEAIDLNQRIALFERRVLGRLENQLLADDKRNRCLDELAAKFERLEIKMDSNTEEV